MTVVPHRETDRLLLRDWRETDIDGLADLYADADARFLGGPCGRSDAWRWMAMFIGHWTLRGYGFWAIEDKATGRFAGHCGIWDPLGWPERELGWGLVPGLRGHGYATEAAGAARAMAYDRFGWTTLVSYIVPENNPSRRVAERLGATLETTVELQGRTTNVFRHPGRIAHN